MLFPRYQAERTLRPRRRLAILSVAFAALAGLPAAGVITASAAGAAPAIHATPAIQEGPCTHATWAHVNSSDGLQCFAHPGTWHFNPQAELHSFCAGNNNGSFVYINVSTDKHTTKDFTAGYSATFSSSDYIQTLTLGSGSGSDSC